MWLASRDNLNCGQLDVYIKIPRRGSASFLNIQAFRVGLETRRSATRLTQMEELGK